MTRLREDTLHVSVRHFVRQAGWQLVAGQYPGGSDDELPPLNVMDPVLACDHSPDPSRHSKNKLTPDLVACKHNIMLIIEMKPTYSLGDERKLEDLLTSRRGDLLSALRDLVATRGVVLPVPLQQLVFVPCLGFGPSSAYSRKASFCYFKVSALSGVTFEGNAVVPAI